MTIIKADFTKGGAGKKLKDEKKPVPLYQLHISLAFSTPLIWRRVQVPGNISLQQLHTLIQLCMGWTGECNHQFYVGKIFYNSSLSEGKNEYYEGNVELQSIEEPMRWCFTYVYDAGDGWEHELVLEEAGEMAKGKDSPLLLDGEWAAPPEEVGSVHVYEEVLWALENPDEQGSQKLLQYHNLEKFDPYAFNAKEINKEIEGINWAV